MTTQADQSSDVNGWEQLMLTPPPAIEIKLRIGIVPESRHVQFQLEVWDASSDDLIAMESAPHVDYGHGYQELLRWFGRAERHYMNHAEPF